MCDEQERIMKKTAPLYFTGPAGQRSSYKPGTVMPAARSASHSDIASHRLQTQLISTVRMFMGLKHKPTVR
jgi:hypothetical protein